MAYFKFWFYKHDGSREEVFIPAKTKEGAMGKADNKLRKSKKYEDWKIVSETDEEGNPDIANHRNPFGPWS